MNKTMFLVVLTLLSFQSFASKSKCPNEWNSLKSIQKQMKLGHRASEMEYLKKEERKRFTAYEHCRKGRNANSKNTVNSANQNLTKRYLYNKSRSSKSNVFKGASINIKGRFSGEKQNAWFDYYNKPKECIKPKSTSQFAKCIVHRDELAKEFEVVWLESNRLPPSIKLGITH